MYRTLLFIALTAATTFVPWRLSAEQAPGTPVSIVVTVEPKRGKAPAPLEAQDITVRQGKDKRPITQFTPLPGDAKTQLLLLFDDSSRSSFDTQIQSLKQFVNALPGSTQVAIAYMRNGTVQMACDFTGDHASAANSIRLTLGPGGADVSPYDSLTEAIKRWPSSDAVRREVIMVSSGIEGLGGGYAPENPYVNAGIESALKAGVQVYTIYSPSVGHEGHSFWRANWGQNFLSQLSDETGGESYFQGFGAPVSLEPFLKDFTERQQHQFLLTFSARPEAKTGLQQIKVSVTEKDASLAAPDKVFVRAGL